MSDSVARTPPAGGARFGLLADGLFLAGLLACWVAYVAPIVSEGRRGYDIFRDVGAAVNIQHGRLWADPAYRGETIWYPPLSPAIVAGLSALADVTPTDCYRWSQLLLNWLIPAGFYVLVRLGCGRRAAIIGTVALLLAMPWWRVEVAHGQPSIHSIVWGWAIIVLYAVAARRRRMHWPILCGVVLGAAFWHHPFVPAVLVAAMILDVVWQWRLDDREGRAAGRRALLAVGVGLALAAPLLFQLLRGPVLNSEPREYLAEELRDPTFALLSGNPWLWGLAVLGVVVAIRRANRAGRLLVACLGVTLIAQVPGYLRLFWGEAAAGVPMVVPHEFQRLFQIALAAAIGIGADVLISWLLGRLALQRGRALAGAGLTLLFCLITGVWWVKDVPHDLRRYLTTVRLSPAAEQAAAWIRESTDIDDVFAIEHDYAFQWLNPQTGRKVWLMPRGHSNPRVDWQQRARVLDELRRAATPAELARLAREHEIDYLLPTAGWSPVGLGSGDAGADTALRLAYDAGGIRIFQVERP